MDEDRQDSDLQVARRALITSAAGYAGMLAVALAVHFAFTRRDAVTRAAARVRAVFRPPARLSDLDAAAAIRADLDQVTHADLSGEQA
jgi:hypothetical protein